MLTNHAVIYAIPGWGFSSKIFSNLSTSDFTIMGVDYFDFDVILCDEQCLNVFADKLSKLIPDNSILLGWSLGGLIAIKLASLFSNKVKKLILISSQPKLLADIGWQGIGVKHADSFVTGFNNDSEMQIIQFIRLINYPNRQLAGRKYLNQYFLRQHKRNLLNLLPILFNSDLRSTYQALTADILHVINSDDAVISQNQYHLKKLNSNVEVVQMNNAGHAGFIYHVDHYKAIIKKFLCQ